MGKQSTELPLGKTEGDNQQAGLWSRRRQSTPGLTTCRGDTCWGSDSQVKGMGWRGEQGHTCCRKEAAESSLPTTPNRCPGSGPTCRSLGAPGAGWSGDREALGIGSQGEEFSCMRGKGTMTPCGDFRFRRSSDSLDTKHMLCSRCE